MFSPVLTVLSMGILLLSNGSPPLLFVCVHCNFGRVFTLNFRYSSTVLHVHESPYNSISSKYHREQRRPTKSMFFCTIFGAKFDVFSFLAPLINMLKMFLMAGDLCGLVATVRSARPVKAQA